MPLLRFSPCAIFGVKAIDECAFPPGKFSRDANQKGSWQWGDIYEGK
jgi:hypothetical protein